MAKASQLPVNVYQEGGRIMVTAPLPGLEPQNIHCRVEGRTLLIRTELRGPGQDRTQAYLVREWTVGAQERRLELPQCLKA